MRATIHSHHFTGDAYDACQTDENHKQGDVLLVLDEGVVGVVDTWPIAVTANFGYLHTVLDWPRWLKENPKLVDGVHDAAALAAALELELADGLRELAETWGEVPR